MDIRSKYVRSGYIRSSYVRYICIWLGVLCLGIRSGKVCELGTGMGVHIGFG